MLVGNHGIGKSGTSLSELDYINQAQKNLKSIYKGDMDPEAHAV
jgi:hypothetical protein